MKPLLVDLLCCMDYSSICYFDQLTTLRNPLNYLVNVILRIQLLLHIPNEELLEIIIPVTLEWREHNHLMLTDCSFIRQKYSRQYTQKCRTIFLEMLKNKVETSRYLGSRTSWFCLDFTIDNFVNYCRWDI